MNIAMAVRKRADCLGNRVGAVIVKENRIVATGYNGTPAGMPNCTEGGCHRCGNRAKYPTGTGYDMCICVHAEQNALLSAARFGISVQGGALYSTMQPCFGCFKEMLQAGIQSVCYLHSWIPSDTSREQYETIQGFFSGGVRVVEMQDPEASWAISRLREKTPVVQAVPDEIGHG